MTSKIKNNTDIEEQRHEPTLEEFYHLGEMILN